MSVPITCPITLQEIVDPVVGPDGHTYERSAIQQWLDAGHRTSPVTREPMTSTQLIPNRALLNNDPKTVASATVQPFVDAPVSITANRLGEKVHVRVSHRTAEERQGTDVIIMLDTSGSMNTEIVSGEGAEKQVVSRMQLATHSVRVCAALLGDHDRLCVMTFNDTAKVLLPLTPMNVAGKALVDTKMKLVSADGMTNIWDALRTAANIAQQNHNRNVTALLLTDGEPTAGTPVTGIERSLRFLNPTNQLRWTLHALGFSNQVDSKLLTEISKWGGGSFGFIPSGDMLGTVCINTIAHSISTANRGVSIQVGDTTVETGPLLLQQTKDFLIPAATSVTTIRHNGVDLPIGSDAVPDIVYARAFLLKTLPDFILNPLNQDLVVKLVEFATDCKRSEDPLINLLGLDVKSESANEGQVLLSRNYLGTWGLHYLRCYLRAHELQHCVNFKDVGLQDYGGSVFHANVAKGDETFALLPAMEKRLVPAPIIANSSTNSINTAPRYAPIDFGAFHNRGGSCFAGECKVLLSDGTRKRIDAVRRGDILWTSTGPAVVRYAIEFNSKNKSQLMTQIGSLWITPWHPILNNSAWLFPSDMFGYTDRLVSKVHNFVLESGHIIDVEGVLCCTLAHEFKGPVIEHEFFGTQKCVDSLRSLPGFAEGRPIFKNCVTIKNAEGLISGWVEE